MDTPTEIVAELDITMKNGDKVLLFHSWNDIIIGEHGIFLLPNSPGWEFNWDTVESIQVINTNSPNHVRNQTK